MGLDTLLFDFYRFTLIHLTIVFLLGLNHMDPTWLTLNTSEGKVRGPKP